jgi:hypothetical protein
MHTYIFDKWEFNYDRELTSEAYSQISFPSIWQCNCVTCQNYKTVREEIYPEEFKSILDLLGINSAKEAEIYHIKKLGFKKHLYGGWFHFIGHFTSNNLSSSLMIYLTENVQISFTDKTMLVPDILKKKDVLQLEFKITIPWVIDKNEPK